MATIARVVENLGVAAYLGAARLVSDPVLLTAAASIVTEARHQTVLNILNTGSAIPSGFDIPFTPSEVLAIASQFISGCDLGIAGMFLRIYKRKRNKIFMIIISQLTHPSPSPTPVLLPLALSSPSPRLLWSAASTLR